MILGASFDPPEENLAFAQNNHFAFRLLSDVDRAVGAAYGTRKAEDEPNPQYARRLTFLIDPEGVVRRTYEVTDREAHAGEVLADLRRLKGTA